MWTCMRMHSQHHFVAILDLKTSQRNRPCGWSVDAFLLIGAISDRCGLVAHQVTLWPALRH